MQGLLDVFLVALLARLVGLLAGSRLEDYLPGIKVFGGGFLDQSGWLVALLIASFWLASGIRFAVALMQSLLSAEVWNDLVNKVYDNLMRQKYDFFIRQRTANLSEKFNRILNSVSTGVISPILLITGNLGFSCFALGWRCGCAWHEGFGCFYADASRVCDFFQDYYALFALGDQAADSLRQKNQSVVNGISSVSSRGSIVCSRAVFCFALCSRWGYCKAVRSDLSLASRCSSACH